MLRRLGEAAAAAFVVGRSRHYASAGEELHQSADRVLCWRSMERFLGERQGGEGARREAERSRVAFEGRGGTRIRRPKQVKAPSRPSIQCRGGSLPLRLRVRLFPALPRAMRARRLAFPRPRSLAALPRERGSRKRPPRRHQSNRGRPRLPRALINRKINAPMAVKAGTAVGCEWCVAFRAANGS